MYLACLSLFLTDYLDTYFLMANTVINDRMQMIFILTPKWLTVVQTWLIRINDRQ